MALEAGAHLDPSDQRDRNGVQWSLKSLKVVLREIRANTRPGLLGHQKEFEHHLQRFLERHQEYYQRRQLNAKLPTWTPNWALPLMSPHQSLLLLSEESRNAYRAAGRTRPQIRYDESSRAMIMSGILIDHVAHVPRSATGNGGDPLKTFWKAARLYAEPGQIGSPYGAYAESLEAFRRLLSLGRTPLSPLTLQLVILEAGSDDGHLLTSVTPAATATTEAMQDEVLSVYKAWVGDVGRQFFITRSGYYGAGPTAVETGDLVLIPFGGKVPLLLRSNGPVCYLVEECCKLHFACPDVWSRSSTRVLRDRGGESMFWCVSFIVAGD